MKKSFKRPYPARSALCICAFALINGLGNIAYGLNEDQSYARLKERITKEFDSRKPHEWSETIPGVLTRFATRTKSVALTFDACGSANDSVDTLLIDFLKREHIPATLFICGRWIKKYPDSFHDLSRNGLFEIENHGQEHKPCSVSGNSIYGIPGTGNAAEVVDEIEQNARTIERLTGRKPVFYRSGTAYYDEIGVAIAGQLGYTVAGFSVLGDKGATYSKEQVTQALLNARSGDIIICHMNHPESGTAEGVIKAVVELRKKGFTFVKLSEVGLQRPLNKGFVR